ncbi:hypothetical protein BHM03_00051366 [Ensete ventricosum]|nr:hypothetical protein BHM03_00051366 [Ensete ventricosum]
MKDLCGTKVRKDDAGYYALYMSDLAHQDPDKEMQARWRKLKNSTKMALFNRVHDAGRLITFMDYRITSLQQEIDALKSRGGPEAVVATEERASELEKELEDQCKANLSMGGGIALLGFSRVTPDFTHPRLSRELHESMVFFMRRPLFNLSARISFACRGAVAARGRRPDDDVDLFLNRPLWLGRRVSRRPIIGE